MLWYSLLSLLFFSSCVISIEQPTKDERNKHIDRIEQHINHFCLIRGVVKEEKNFLHEELSSQLFQHELMTGCMEIMYKEESLDAFIDIWKFYSKHQKIMSNRHDMFLRESCILMILYYNYCLGKHTKGLWSDMSNLYNEIAGLPLPELLNILDFTYHALKRIFLVYQAPNTMSWIVKFWWVPPIAMTAIGYTIIKWYITRTQSISTT